MSEAVQEALAASAPWNFHEELGWLTEREARWMHDDEATLSPELGVGPSKSPAAVKVGWWPCGREVPPKATVDQVGYAGWCLDDRFAGSLPFLSRSFLEARLPRMLARAGYVRGFVADRDVHRLLAASLPSPEDALLVAVCAHEEAAAVVADDQAAPPEQFVWTPPERGRQFLSDEELRAVEAMLAASGRHVRGPICDAELAALYGGSE